MRIKKKKILRESQAYLLLMKFGSYEDAYRCLQEVGYKGHFYSMQRWTYAAPQGSDGIIPSRHIKLVGKAAKKAGIILSSEELSPIQGEDFEFEGIERGRLTSVAQRQRLRYDSEAHYKETYDYRNNFRKTKILSKKLSEEMKDFTFEERLNILKNFRFNPDGSYTLKPNPRIKKKKKKYRPKKKVTIEDLM